MNEQNWMSDSDYRFEVTPNKFLFNSASVHPLGTLERIHSSPGPNIPFDLGIVTKLKLYYTGVEMQHRRDGGTQQA